MEEEKSFDAEVCHTDSSVSGILLNQSFRDS